MLRLLFAVFTFVLFILNGVAARDEDTVADDSPPGWGPPTWFGKKPELIAEIAAISLFTLAVLSEALVTNQVWRVFRPSSPSSFTVSLSGERTRAAFLILLWIAGLARILSFGWIAWWWNELIAADERSDSGASLLWDYALVIAVPATAFLSTYSVIVLFWAQIYYTARFMVLNNLKSSYWFLNAGVYLTIIALASLTQILKAYGEFLLYINILSGVLYTLIAVAFCFYGIKVAVQFSGESTDRVQDARRAAVVRRVLLLSSVCPLLFQIRGLYDIGMGVGLVPITGLYEGQLTVTWDLLIIFLSEWIPSAFVLMSFWPQTPAVKPHAVGLSAEAEAYCRQQATGDPAHQFESLSQRLLPVHESYKSMQPNDILLNFAPANVYPLGAAGPTRVT